MGKIKQEKAPTNRASVILNEEVRTSFTEKVNIVQRPKECVGENHADLWGKTLRLRVRQRPCDRVVPGNLLCQLEKK